MGSSLVNNHTGKSGITFANILGYLFIAGGLGLIIFRHFLCSHCLGFISTLFVHDAHLDIGPRGFTLFLFGAGVLMLILGLVILLRQKRPFCFLCTFLNGYFLNEDVRRFFFPPHCFLPQRYYLITFWISLFISFLMIFLFRFHFSPLIEPIFKEAYSACSLCLRISVTDSGYSGGSANGNLSPSPSESCFLIPASSS